MKHARWTLAIVESSVLRDLNQQGMLDDTLVICNTEFGRQTVSQGGSGKGLDHNAGEFTGWMAGGGIKVGVNYGGVDELRYKAFEAPANCFGLPAMALHVVGVVHTRLAFCRNGTKKCLADVHGRVMMELLT